MSDLIPFVLSEERSQIRAEIEGLPVSVIFDGTTRFGEALAIILRYVDHSSLTIHQRLIRIQLLTKSMTTGEEVARELSMVLGPAISWLQCVTVSLLIQLLSGQ